MVQGVSAPQPPAYIEVRPSDATPGGVSADGSQQAQNAAAGTQSPSATAAPSNSIEVLDPAVGSASSTTSSTPSPTVDVVPNSTDTDDGVTVPEGGNVTDNLPSTGRTATETVLMVVTACFLITTGIVVFRGKKKIED